MRNTTVGLLVLLLLATAPACGSGAEEDATPPKAAKAAAIADEIAGNPDEDLGQILKRHGVTEEEFRALMFEIAEDEALSAAYENARRR
ncbi:MAG: hypothetical protein ACYSX0_10805 [Planctomycetota bacterium]|jgi:hypothetical protein